MIADLLSNSVKKFSEYKRIIEAITTAASVTEYIRSKSDYGLIIKPDSSPVTVADLTAQMILVNGIRRLFPDDLIIAEEDPSSLLDPEIRSEIQQILETFSLPFNEFTDMGQIRDEKQRFWTIDPIDGTKGFLRNGQYAICLALVEDATVKAAFVACPNLKVSFEEGTGTLFLALRENGVFETSLKSGAFRKLEKRIDKLENSTMVESYEAAHTSHELSAGLRQSLNLCSKPLQFDSQVKYGMLARGDASLYLRKPKSGYQEKIWDHAPGWLLVSESGGNVTDFEGNPVVFNAHSSLSLHQGLIASTYGEQDHLKVISYLNQLL